MLHDLYSTRSPFFAKSLWPSDGFNFVFGGMTMLCKEELLASENSSIEMHRKVEAGYTRSIAVAFKTAIFEGP